MEGEARGRERKEGRGRECESLNFLFPSRNYGYVYSYFSQLNSW